jgi:predicted nucleic acid-binding protein
MPILVDSNVILDIVTADPKWAEWSSQILAAQLDPERWINPIIFTALCGQAESVAAVDQIIEQLALQLVEMPRDALFATAKAHLRYRRAGGKRERALPDFYIGGHAESMGIPLLTRDRARYLTYFPRLHLISP